MDAQTVQRITDLFKIPSLRPQQKEALSSILERQDTVLNLPTGSGKSLCFEAITTALASTDDIVIVVSPLAFLIKAELEKLHGFGISAVYVGEKASYSLQELKEGKFR